MLESETDYCVMIMLTVCCQFEYKMKHDYEFRWLEKLCRPRQFIAHKLRLLIEVFGVMNDWKSLGNESHSVIILNCW